MEREMTDKLRKQRSGPGCTANQMAFCSESYKTAAEGSSKYFVSRLRATNLGCAGLFGRVSWNVCLEKG